jgi:hypothetical protein
MKYLLIENNKQENGGKVNTLSLFNKDIVFSFSPVNLKIQGVFNFLQQPSAVEISNFYFGSISKLCKYYIINSTLYFDIEDIKDFFNNAQKISITYDSRTYTVTPSIVLNNNIHLLELFSQFPVESNKVSINIKIIQKHNLHINQINKIHYIQKISDAIHIDLRCSEIFDTTTNVNLEFIDRLYKEQLHIKTSFPNVIQNIEVNSFFFPEINNISHNYENNIFNFTTNGQLYSILIPNRLWNHVALYNFMENFFQEVTLKFFIDSYNDKYFELKVYEKVFFQKENKNYNINKRGDLLNENKQTFTYEFIDSTTFTTDERLHSFVYVSTTFTVQKTLLSEKIGIVDFDMTESITNTTPVNLEVILTSYLKINNSNNSELLYVYDQNQKLNLYPITVTLPFPVHIHDLFIFFKVQNYTADFNNSNYNIVLKLH